MWTPHGTKKSLQRYNTSVQATLSSIRHNHEILDDSKAQAEVNTEQTKQPSYMIKQLADLIKIYQEKEVLIIDNTNTAFKDNLNIVFQQNRVFYHDLINQGFSAHIQNVSDEVINGTKQLKVLIADLQQPAIDSKQTSKGNSKEIIEQIETGLQQMLNKAQVLSSVTKRSDGHYAKIDPAGCIKDFNARSWSHAKLSNLIFYL